MRRRLRGMVRALAGPVVATAVVAALAGCSHGTVNDAGAYCGLLATQRPQLDAPITSTLEIAPRLAVFQKLHDRAPLTVQRDWQTLMDLLTAANQVDLGDQKAVAALHDQALAATSAATEIVQDAKAVCGLTLPTVGTLAPPANTIPPGAPPKT